MSSSQPNISIPMFTSANWSQWWPTMTAYIEVSGCGWAMDFPAPMLDPKADNNERNFYIAWTKANLTIVGLIKLHLSDSLKGKYQTQTTAASLISALTTEYTTPGISGTFALSKELLDMKVAQSTHPAPPCNKVTMLFTHLEATRYITLVIYTSSPEPPMDPHALAHCPTLMYQGEQGPLFHIGIKDAIALAHRLELPITMENVHRLDTGLQIQGPIFLSTAVRLPLKQPKNPSRVH